MQQLQSLLTEEPATTVLVLTPTTARISLPAPEVTLLSRFAIDDKDVKLLSKRYSREPYGIAFKKGNSTVKLKENLDFAVNDLKRKNVIARLRKKWDIYG